MSPKKFSLKNSLKFLREYVFNSELLIFSGVSTQWATLLQHVAILKVSAMTDSTSLQLLDTETCSVTFPLECNFLYPCTVINGSWTWLIKCLISYSRQLHLFVTAAQKLLMTAHIVQIKVLKTKRNSQRERQLFTC